MVPFFCAFSTYSTGCTVSSHNCMVTRKLKEGLPICGLHRGCSDGDDERKIPFTNSVQLFRSSGKVRFVNIPFPMCKKRENG